MLEGVVIERYPDHLYFSNPGTMLITVEEFFESGLSICRNRILQKMFIVFGRGERLGSGADIISQGWKENNWPEPEIKEHFGPSTDRVELTLRLSSVSGPITEQGSESSVKSSVKIVQAMRENAHITAAELTLMLGISERAIYKNIAKLRDAGIIRRKGSDIAGEWEVLK